MLAIFFLNTRDVKNELEKSVNNKKGWYFGWYKAKSFRVSAPTVWNSLPDSLKSEDTSREQFKRLLKTVMFERAYL